MANSTGLILVNKILREAGENPVSTLANPSRNTQLIIDFVNDVLEEAVRESNWSMYQAATTVTTGANSSLATISAVNDISKFRPLQRVLDTTDNIDLIEVPNDKWRDVTQQSDTSLPRFYRRFGQDSSNRMILEFYPTPSVARTYTVQYWQDEPQLTADAAGDVITFPFPDSLIVNGAAWHHKDYLGDNPTTNLRKYDLAMRRLKDQNRTSAQLVMGSRKGSHNSATLGPRLPTSFPRP